MLKPRRSQLGRVRHFISGDEVLGNDQAAALKISFRETLARTFIGHADQLAARLRECRPRLLWRLSWGLDRVKAEGYEGFPFKRSPEFATTILEAADIDAEVMLPQIATLLVKTRDRTDRTQSHAYMKDLAERLFGNEQILQLFASRESQQGVGHGPYHTMKRGAAGTAASGSHL